LIAKFDLGVVKFIWVAYDVEKAVKAVKASPLPNERRYAAEGVLIFWLFF